MKRDVLVRLTEECKQSLIDNDCFLHVKEFGSCIGKTEDPVFPDCDDCDEINVRWEPSGLDVIQNMKYI
jgi:hypothetical protein